MTTFNVVGQNHIRLDAVEKATGRSTYASDVYLPGMLMCKLLTSTHSHARIVSIDTTEALELPGRQSNHHRQGLPGRVLRLGSRQGPANHGARPSVLHR